MPNISGLVTETNLVQVLQKLKVKKSFPGIVKKDRFRWKISRVLTKLVTKDDKTTALEFAIANKKG